ncbi:hypothetical protein CALCODRAFT_481017 [Calocera cornea HHB12733]|uniref:F-box domain-containing protein n=1 Tax=Calocera cornea HHB12733 TaxID=1353952 RepID=A0A165I4Z4_9BASI|nr:hypothetical protein CALCODRAFT_481017 [Calocera cornea HHB12733]
MSPPAPAPAPAGPHRALLILDILDLLLAALPTPDLQRCPAVCTAWFTPAVRHLWRRRGMARSIWDALDLGTDKAGAPPAPPPSARARTSLYLAHLSTLEFALSDNTLYRASPCVLTTAQLLALAAWPLPALHTLNLTLPPPHALPDVLPLARPRLTRLWASYTHAGPHPADLAHLAAAAPALQELMLTTYAPWPTAHALDALPHLRALRNLHLQSAPLAPHHLAAIGRLPALEHLMLANPTLPDPPVPGQPHTDAHLHAYALSPGAGAGPELLPCLTSLQVHGGSLLPMLALLAALPRAPPLRRLALRALWTTPALHTLMLRQIARLRALHHLVLSLKSGEPASPRPGSFSPAPPAAAAAWGEYTLLPLSALPSLRTLDLTLTSQTPLWQPALSPSLLAALAASAPHLQQLRLVTFDHSYHYASPAHTPTIRLPDLAVLAAGCTHLTTLQLEFALPDRAARELAKRARSPPGRPDPGIAPPNPNPNPNPNPAPAPHSRLPPSDPLPPPTPHTALQHLLIAWSRLPAAPSPALSHAAAWTARLFPHARLGWGRWAEGEEEDVPEGVWEAHSAFGLRELGEAGPAAAAAAGEVDADRDRDGDSTFAGVDTARARARDFAHEVERFQRLLLLGPGPGLAAGLAAGGEAGPRRAGLDAGSCGGEEGAVDGTGCDPPNPPAAPRTFTHFPFPFSQLAGSRCGSVSTGSRPVTASRSWARLPGGESSSGLVRPAGRARGTGGGAALPEDCWLLVPLVLVLHREARGEALHGWTLLFPTPNGWGMAFLPSPLSSGTLLAGQREIQSRGLEASLPSLPFYPRESESVTTLAGRGSGADETLRTPREDPAPGPALEVPAPAEPQEALEPWSLRLRLPDLPALFHPDSPDPPFASRQRRSGPTRPPRRPARQTRTALSSGAHWCTCASPPAAGLPERLGLHILYLLSKEAAQWRSAALKRAAIKRLTEDGDREMAQLGAAAPDEAGRGLCDEREFPTPTRGWAWAGLSISPQASAAGEAGKRRGRGTLEMVVQV